LPLTELSEVTLTVPTAADVTVTVADAAVLPPAPLHVSTYVEDPTLAGVTAKELFNASAPDQSPDAVHAVAFADVHVSVVGDPSVTDVGDALSVTVGATVPELQLLAATGVQVTS
jgi:hypothetical protein